MATYYLSFLILNFNIFIFVFIYHFRPFQLQNCAARVADLHKDANLKFAAEYEVWNMLSRVTMLYAIIKILPLIFIS